MGWWTANRSCSVCHPPTNIENVFAAPSAVIDDVKAEIKRQEEKQKVCMKQFIEKAAVLTEGTAVHSEFQRLGRAGEGRRQCHGG